LELVCHFDANDNPDPIILDYWCAGTHYGGGAGNATSPAGERLEQGCRPDFSLLQRAGRSEGSIGRPISPHWKPPLAIPLFRRRGMTTPRHSLAGRACPGQKVEKAQWPYDWVNGVDYPHKECNAAP
jgi:hypothetical protein